VEVAHLRPGDVLWTYEGHALRLEEVERREQRLRVYNFEVRGLHTYFTSGARLLVHNSNCELLRLSDPARKQFRTKRKSKAMDIHYEDLVRRKTGGSSGYVNGREIDSVTDEALIEAKRSLSAVHNPDKFIKSYRQQIRATIRSANETGRRAEFWFKYGVHSKLRKYIEERGGIVITGLGD